ncbi:cobalamin B12-binding domain-containing protein [Desulfonema magnum]|uniref:Cobalamin-binding domain-containing protein n=1 Tax=Desulfonema magnum TaxID=45655 RepID=A0A975BXY8_9BACT|nr:cobalamin B12-binding domain-containing protein [Desulfonema magnum]QTA93378.1 Cobalamin-binding domain-containing protein [Desulfonema magnum]
MDPTCTLFRTKLTDTIREWKDKGIPSRSEFEARAGELLEWKADRGITGLWKNPLLMLTATLDDGMGMGLKVIHRYAEVAGLRVVPLGLLQTPENIVSECQKHRPDFLGLTVLQLDTDTLVAEISAQLPQKTRIIAGGPVFRYDPDFAERTGIHVVAKNAISFLEFLLGTDSAGVSASFIQ